MLLEVREERMVVISDLHLGSPFSNAGRSLISFLQWVHETDYSLCINGDGLEILQSNFMLLASHSMGVLDAIRRMTHDGRPIYYIVGNHDIHLEHLLNTWMGRHISPFLNVRSGDSRIRIEHGHLYDPFFVKHPVIYELVTRMAGPLINLHPDVYRGWIAYQRAKAWMKQALKHEEKHGGSPFDEAAETLLERGFDAVIFGHTHRAEEREVAPGKRYLNSGNWMQGGTYIEIDRGEGRLRQWKQRKLLG